MSAPKFTPGPWEIDVGGNFVDLGVKGYVARSDAAGFSGASLGGIARAMLDHGHKPRDFKRAVANMRLMSAAPDLYAVVERYVDSQDPCVRGGDADPATCECVACGTTREARAALAKARGES